MGATTTALVVAGLVLLLGGVTGIWAEVTLGGLSAEGEVWTGVRSFPQEPSENRRGKFEEYRDVPEGLFLDRLQLRLFSADDAYSFELGGAQWGQQDQEFALRAGRPGRWDFGFQWDQLRHLDSTTGRTLSTEVDRGVWRLPTPRPSLFSHNAAPGIDEISQRWDTARLFLLITPTPDLDLRAEYTRINKDGERPFGVAFGSPGNNFYEVLEPIAQTIHDARLRATLARETWQLQLGYAVSHFQNSIKSVTADNPCFGLTAAVTAGGCGAGDGGAAAPGTALVSVAPDNIAHTLTAAGGVNLPMRTRLTAALSYSLRLQDESFLPHTVNPAFAGNAALALPQRSLDGRVGVTVLNLQATTRPLRPLTLGLKYRLFDYDDMSDEPAFPGHVVDDRTLVVEERRAGRFQFTRHNIDLDARWRFRPTLAGLLGAGWERWDRNEHREVPRSDEYLAKAGVDWSPTDWFQSRLAYRPSIRRIPEYKTFAHLEHTVVEELAPSDQAQGQSTLLRKFDEGERDRQRLDLLLQLAPADALIATITADWRSDEYVDSPLGLQDATAWSGGFDLSWRPTERVTITGGYVHEVIHQKQRSRSRPVTGTTTFDFADFDWISVHTDTVDTIQLGAGVGLIPRVLDWTLGASYSYALGRVETRNPVAPTSGTAAQDATATARRWPAFEDTLVRLDTALKYGFRKAWTLALGYAFESFQKSDWRTDRLNPFVPGVTSIWLGNDARDYDAHIVSLTLGYRFK